MCVHVCVYSNKIEERAQNNSNNKSEHQSYSKSNNPYTIGS